MSGSLALWYESDESPVGGHEPCIELHFNMWRELPGDSSDALDVGFRIKEKHGIETLNLFVPGEVYSDDLTDLSDVLRQDKTLCAVFNETLVVREGNNGFFSAVNPDSGTISLHVMPFDKASDIYFEHVMDDSKLD